MHDQERPTTSYPADVSRAMQMLALRQISDADAVVNALGDVRHDATIEERKRIATWLRTLPCPTPANWKSIAERIEAGSYDEG
jgi:hypothetical protein